MVQRVEIIDLPIETPITQQRREENHDGLPAALTTRPRDDGPLFRNIFSVVETEVVQIAHSRFLGLGWGIRPRGPPTCRQGDMGNAQRHSSYSAWRSSRRNFSSRMGVDLRRKSTSSRTRNSVSVILRHHFIRQIPVAPTVVILGKALQTTDGHL